MCLLVHKYLKSLIIYNDYTCIGETARINPEVVFDEEDGKGIIAAAVMDETKRAVCRIRAA